MRAYEDLEIRKLKERRRAKVLAVLGIKSMPPHWNKFVLHLSSSQQSALAELKISRKALSAMSYDKYQEQGNQTAHDPVAKVVANAVMALPRAHRRQFVELFDVVFGAGVFESIEEGWTFQT